MVCYLLSRVGWSSRLLSVGFDFLIRGILGVELLAEASVNRWVFYLLKVIIS